MHFADTITAFGALGLQTTVTGSQTGSQTTVTGSQTTVTGSQTTVAHGSHGSHQDIFKKDFNVLIDN